MGPSSLPRASHLPKDSFGNLTLPPSIFSPASAGLLPQVSPLAEFTTSRDGPIFEVDEENEEKTESHAPGPARMKIFGQLTTSPSNFHHFADIGLSNELGALYESLQKCMDLRDKYIRVSQQRLGDNPRDHDGVFRGFKDNAGDVSGIKPDASPASVCTAADDKFSSWKIYPPPPPPHWHYKDQRHSSGIGDHEKPFDFSKCQIPESHSWEYRLDEKGVFQIYSDAQTDSKGNSSLKLYSDSSDRMQLTKI